ncbi:MAG TPA: trehalose-6-phosphate synthase [Xanthobacteraceae bacterium]
MIVVVSNRVARMEAEEPVTGGLASALLPVVKNSGAIWVGSSGRVRDASEKDSFAKIEALGAGALATVDLPAAHYQGYYEGFANSGLWPALHSRADLIQVTVDNYKSYREVNAFMARALLRFNRRDATFWVQDYHFLTLGSELRRLGVEQSIGFFLHTPWPVRVMMHSVPHHRELVRAMLAYDLIGFQTDQDRLNFKDYVKHELGLAVVSDTVASEHGRSRLATFPIGINVDEFAARAAKAAARPEVSRLRASLQNTKLLLGVDRLDYSKGICNRIRAVDRLLLAEPGLKRQISLMQIAVPSRGQIEAYRQLKTELATLVGEINGRHAEVDWMPIRYLNKGFAQSTLAGFYRTAQVGLVTPLQDGMNLVAKEYVAAQNPFDPGVLVLSEFAGAAKELDAAVLVNPHDIDGMAQKISAALGMPIEERQERWRAMVAKLRPASVQAWFSDFVLALAEVRRTPLPAAASARAALPAPFGRAERSTAPARRRIITMSDVG